MNWCQGCVWDKSFVMGRKSRKSSRSIEMERIWMDLAEVFVDVGKVFVIGDGVMHLTGKVTDVVPIVRACGVCRGLDR